MNKKMELRTGLFDEKDYKILESVMGQLSDGIWENSRPMEKYWRNISIKKDVSTNEVIIDFTLCIFYGKTDYEIKKWFATKIKQIIKQEIEDGDHNIKWSKDCHERARYIHDHLPVADAYNTYTKLLKE